MTHIPVYGKEHTFLDEKTGLLFRNSRFKETASIHTHTFYEFFIVAEGSALHLVNNSIQTITQGDLIFIRPKDTHSYEFYYSGDFRIVNIGFSEQIFQNVRLFLDHSAMLQSLADAELPVCVHMGDAERKEIICRFEEIGALMETTAVQKTIFYAKCCLADIFARHFFSYETEEYPAVSCPSWFQPMLEEMQKIDNLRIGFPKMIELSACSSNHLCRVFKSVMSVTPTEYINTRRLEYSVYLLTQTSKEIIEISMLCGFSSLSHFYHLFKKKYQCPPSRFRKMNGRPPSQ
ncbi:AraC family transcriptional regulator [Anaerostipes sp.]|uniref:AraC family transcriptional regulator n=1 Tax=Anaerostipes sp. TaxID=1872530 RepID=UPI0025BDCF02|nr:AraC family transcriptional regulator [Anaerostipes sp.]MBS7009185.1 helix-turn-helix domain-containing protein [Anaerostipes sp.]